MAQTKLKKKLTKEHKEKIRHTNLKKILWNQLAPCTPEMRIFLTNLSRNRKRHSLSKETKRKISLANLGRKHTEETKEKYRQANLGRKHTEETKLKISMSNMGKKMSKEAIRKSNQCRIGKKASMETRERQRVSKIKRIEILKNNGQPIYPAIGNNETEILNQIEVEFEVSLERQYRVAGFFVDGYDEENNIVYEVDEPFHFTVKKMKKDREREEIISNRLNCGFVRIQDY